VRLSVAQFGREAIGEHVRDKIAASKRKEFWVGGRVPLGYQNLGHLPKCQFRFQGENGLRSCTRYVAEEPAADLAAHG
jgi:DNA invertase Pin-like site-specific DNA recombinase